MFRRFKLKRQIALTLIVTMVMQFIYAGVAYALSEGPAQPEAMQFEPVDVTDMVNLQTGDFVYSLPLMEVPGPEGGFPISMSYHAGIGTNQEPTWVGLGWSLNPGSINRSLNGYPDDFKGDHVVTHYESNVITYEASSFGVGWGPVGLNFTNINNQGWGVTGFSIGVPIPGTPIAIGVSHNNGATSIGISGYGNIGGDFFATAGVSYRLGGKGANYNIGIGYGEPTEDGHAPSQSLVGFSFAGGSGGANFSIAGGGFSSMSQVDFKDAITTESSWGLTIPIGTTGAWISFGGYEYTWQLNQTYVEDAYGYIHQPYYHSSSSTSKKYERQLQGKWLYPTQDIYATNAQGISGTFMPFVKSAYMLLDRSATNEQAILKYEDTGFGPYDIGNYPIFKFLGDEGSNFTTKDGGTELPTVTGWGEDYQNIYGNYTDEKYSGKKIFADIDAESGKIMGFKITDVDGKIYEFYQPVYNYTMYSHSTSTQGQLTLTSYSKITVPFASNWLLTAVKGPDYVDVSGSPSGMDEQDYGFWVKFNYIINSLRQPWRSPYTGTAPGISNAGEMYASGIREVVYLTSIETPTHKADFEASISKNSNIAPIVSSDLNIKKNVCGPPRIHTFTGDWSTYIQNAQPNDVIITAQAWYSLIGNIIDITIKKSDITSYSYDANTNIFTINENVTPYELGGLPFTLYYDQTFLIGDLVQQQFAPVTKQLDQIVLYKKSGMNNYSRLKAVKMNYDYSLCQQTPNSADPNKGKLTLKSVEFLDKLNSPSIPPYKFEYANDAPGNTELNPNFNENDWDRWGGYRDGAGGTDRDKYKHMTPQDKSRADKVAAWSLTKVIHPSGSEIAVEYESDDYYFVQDGYDLTYSIQHSINDQPRTSRNYVIFTSSIPSTIKIGEKFLLYMKETTYDNEFGYYSYYYRLTEKTVTNINTTLNKVEFEGNYEFYEDYPGQAVNITYEFSAYTSPPQIYGGGLRVKSITTNENDKIFKTIYTYKNEYGFSSGVTYSLPNQYRSFSTPIPYEVDGEPYFNYLETYMTHEKSYGRPGPGVIYSTVEVANIDPINNITLNGKTRYEFFTALDAPYLVTSNGSVINIDNRSGIAGKPKKVTYYQQFVDDGIKYKPLKVDSYTYNYSDEINNNSQVVKVDNEVRTVLTSNYPLGITQEKYRFKNENSGYAGNVNNKFQNVYLTKTETKEYFYPGETNATPNDSMITTTKIFEWDARSGISVSVATKDSRNDKIRIERNQPATWKYAFETTLEPKNMLSQRFQSSTYIPVSFDFNNLKNYLFPTTDIIVSNVTTWASLGTDGDYTYRVNDVLVYDNSYAYVDLTYNELRNTDVGFKRPSTQSPWKTISNVTKYDRYSHPIEESLFEYPRYASAQYGYNEALPEAIINGGGGSLNILGNEASYLSFESGGLNTQTYCKSEDDRWSLYTNNYISTDAHTGSYCFKILGGNPNYGPTKDFKPRDIGNQQRQYKFSFWVKTETGFTNGSLVFHSKANDDVNNNAYPSVTGAVVTAPITDTQGKWVYVEGIIDLGKVRALGSIPDNTLLRIRCFPQNNSAKYMLVDDFRFQPVDANMVTYTYDPITWNVTSITDNNNVTTYYEYDESGRLKRVREQDKKIVKTYEYQFGRSLSN